MKKFYLIIVLIACPIIFAYAQKKNTATFSISYPSECQLIEGNDSIEAFYISAQPITNRAYLIYMDWLKNCYKDYPEQWYLSLPDFGTMDGEINYTDCYAFIELINNADELIKSYMFNPVYIDYPVIGISWKQAADFCKWLSDRYNEHLLMSKNFLSPFPDDYNEHCFTLESYLAGQYERPGKKIFQDKLTKEKGIKWEHHLLTPSFRLPSNLELRMAANSKLISDELKPYPLPAFLNSWQYFGVKDGKIIYSNCSVEANEEVVIQSIHVKAPQEKLSEWFLDYGLESTNITLMNIYEQLGQKQLDYAGQSLVEKDNLGNMGYFILTEKDNKPLIISSKPKLIESDPATSKYKIFRYAVNVVK